MLSGIYSATASINATEQNQEILARNLSNIDTPGYRRAFAVHVTPAETDADTTFSAMVSSGREGVGDVHYDFSQGALKTTGRPLDLALDGEGFFEFNGPDGPLYSRSGVLFIGEGGQLVGANGFAVQGEGGPLTIPPQITPDRISINHDGTLSANEAVLGRLRIVTFEDLSTLKLEGETMFTATDAPATPATANVIQGAREGSNVAATGELIQMLIGLRQHEAAQKALQSISEAIATQTQSKGA